MQEKITVRGDTVLHTATRSGITSDLFNTADHNKKHINDQNSDGDTALHIACQKGNLNNVTVLITNFNADTELKNNAGKKALDVAYDHKHYAVVRKLAEHHGAQTQKRIATIKGQLDNHITTFINQTAKTAEYFETLLPYDHADKIKLLTDSLSVDKQQLVAIQKLLSKYQIENILLQRFQKLGEALSEKNMDKFFTKLLADIPQKTFDPQAASSITQNPLQTRMQSYATEITLQNEVIKTKAEMLPASGVAEKEQALALRELRKLVRTIVADNNRDQRALQEFQQTLAAPIAQELHTEKKRKMELYTASQDYNSSLEIEEESHNAKKRKLSRENNIAKRIATKPLSFSSESSDIVIHGTKAESNDERSRS